LKTWYVTVAAILLSVIILVIIGSVSHIDPTVIFAIAPAFLLGAVATVVARIILTGFRFNYIIRAFSKRDYPFFESLIIRFASEFVALTSAAYVGGEVIRAAWLAKKGEASGKALWLPYIEIVFDVYAGNFIALSAGLYALFRGDLFLGGLITAVSLAVLVFVTAVVLLSRKGLIHVPSFFKAPLRWAVGEARAQRLVDKGNLFLEEFCEAATLTFTRGNSFKLFVVGLYTLATVILTAATLWFVALGLGLNVSFVDAALLVYGAIVLGNLPITLGGSGLAEAGAYFYATNVLGVSSWPMVFAWRILSYHLVLLITGVCAFEALRKYVR